MLRLLSNPRGYRGSKAVGLLIALALTTLSSMLSAGPAAADEYCGPPSTSGGYSVTACTDYTPDGNNYGFIYVTLPAGHAACTIRGKVIYLDNQPFGYAQTWTCPAGAITNVRYDIDFQPNGSTYTHGSILNSRGTTIVFASN
jgi:hypothetical protein